MFQIEFSSKPL